MPFHVYIQLIGRNNEVPRGCWDFCRGRTPSVETAAATGLVNGAIDDCMPHMRTIGKCFQEGQYALPGPPTNLQVMLIAIFNAMRLFVWGMIILFN